MKLVVQRVTQTVRSTTGQLHLENTLFCVTLEPPKVPDPKGNGTVCIPKGIYPLTIRWSNKFKRQVPHVENVPNRSEIEHHIGNFPRNTEGCLLVGQDFGNEPDYISNSSLTFTKYMQVLYSYAVLTNSGVDDEHQVWSVGSVEYIDPLIRTS